VPELQVIARHRIAAGKEEEAMALYQQVASATRREPGNISFAVYRSLDDERDIVLLERYASTAALDEHRESAHFNDLVVGRLAPRLESRSHEIYDVDD
jgi:quinol monooxygenase YgiN